MTDLLNRMFRGKAELLLLLSLLAAMAWSAFSPTDRAVWTLEMVWPVALLTTLLAVRRRWRFSLAAYLCFWAWAMLHVVGAHYTFEHVPMGGVMSFLGLTRNPYDRIAHFAVGWFAFPFAELFDRKGWTRSAGAAAFFAVMTTIAMAGVWEIVEWLYAAIDGGDVGAAFLGSQGDVWDAQKDILCDSLGASCAALAYRFPSFRKVLRPNARARRGFSALCAALVLAAICISAVFVSIEADHDCRGQDCPVCEQMRNCVENFQLVGSSAPLCDIIASGVFPPVVKTVACARRAPATTLQALDVRFDE